MPNQWQRFLVGELSWKRLRRSILLVAGGVYAVLVAVGLFLSNGMIFPYRGSSYDGSLPGLELLAAPDGTEIATRFWPRSGAGRIVLLFHGNYEDLGHLDTIAERISRLGLAVLAIDYRGYGLSGGRPTEAACYADARLLIEHARQLGFEDGEMVLWGRSVGGGLATQMASEIAARALVLESPFTTAFRASTRVPLLPFDKFNNLAKIRAVEEPLFIIHGDSDQIIPAWHSEKLFDKHRGRKVRRLIAEAGHNDLWLHPLDGVLAELTTFIEGSPQ